MDDRDISHHPGANGAGGHLDDEVLSAYCDPAAAGGLDPAARALADAHLARCASCREAARELRGTLALLRALPQVAPRRSFVLTPEAIAAVRGKAPRRSRGAARGGLAWIWPVRWASALVTLLLVVTVGLDLGTPAPQAPIAAATNIVNTTPLTAVATAPPPAGNVSQSAPVEPDSTPIVALSLLTPIVFPTPAPTPAPVTPVSAAWTVDWYGAALLLGALASTLAFCGFALPPFLRRRDAAGS